MEIDRPIKSIALALGATLLAAGLTSGCASMEQTLAQAKQEASNAFGGKTTVAASPAAGAASQGIAGTELEGVFKKFPITGSQQPQQYPRVAITITSASPGIFRGSQPAGDECITFDVRLWTSATQSKSFNNLKMCAAQRNKDVPFVSLTIWPGYSGALQNTGAVRNDGPQRPATNFPADPGVVSVWFDRPSIGIFFVGSILYQMGYEWTQPGEMRAWFVSVPKS